MSERASKVVFEAEKAKKQQRWTFEVTVNIGGDHLVTMKIPAHGMSVLDGNLGLFDLDEGEDEDEEATMVASFADGCWVSAVRGAEVEG